MDSTRTGPLAPRDTPTVPSGTDVLLSLLSDPFSSQFASTSVLVSLGTSLGVTLIITLLFCFLRPFNSVVYAPRLRYADPKHAPPPIGKGPFAWIAPVVKTKEQALVAKVGLDAAVFMRFTRMCRNIFLVLTLILCAIIIPVNLVGGSHNWGAQAKNLSAFTKMTPQFLYGKAYWAMVACSYVMTGVVCGFLWTNYRAIMRMRRDYFASPEYQDSLHARTLMVTDIPAELRTDEGLVRIAEEVKRPETWPRAAIGRNVKELPDMIEEHTKAVKDLESYLAKYLRNPNQLPTNRPMCKPSKKDNKHNPNEKVDAIDYLTTRIKVLEMEIREVRESVDKRNAMPYGFVSYQTIDEAHNVAYAGKKKGPHGTIVRLAPRPNDLIWQNLGRSKKDRRWARTVNQFYVAGLTLIWIVPNALIAIFLSNLSNLGRVWPAFQTELFAHPKAWAVVQGVLAPALLSLFYLLLPTIFRRLSMRAGDLSKTSRERHVTHSLYGFFVFNNLIVFSIFAAAWKFVTDVISLEKNDHKDALAAMTEARLGSTVLIALCNVSPFWISWLLQRNLGATVDLAQLFNLGWGSIMRKFFSPTPRELIELSAPPPFDYASYYNYFLFYMTVALCFASLQPIVVPVAAFYFALDSYLKKYLLLYIYITKTESGGAFWRVLFNRSLVAMFLAQIVIAVPIAVNGGDNFMLWAMVPLPFVLIGFKIYCKKAFDDQIKYYSKGDTSKNPEVGLPDKPENRKADRVGVRFGHPALYKPLLTPMVHAKSQHLLKEVYRGRLDDDIDAASVAGYSDTYSMRKMAHGQPGKSAGGAGAAAGFEIIPEGKLDFENFKHRADFADEHGGAGELFQRPGTPSTIHTTRAFAAGHDRGRSSSRGSERSFENEVGSQGTTYPAGYHHTPSGQFRGESPMQSRTASPAGYRSASPASGYRAGHDERGLIYGAAPMPTGTPEIGGQENYDYFRGRSTK